MSEQLLQFNRGVEERSNERPSQPPKGISPKIGPEAFWKPVQTDENPYEDSYCPSEIYEYLLPNGEFFGLFADPFATMQFVDIEKYPKGKYWLKSRLEDHSFVEWEIRLLQFLAEHRAATRNQIHKVVFPETNRKLTVLNFLKKCCERGMLCTFSWASPLHDNRNKPKLYGLTTAGAEAVEALFHRVLSKEFCFIPFPYRVGTGPSMNTFFIDLVCNELYSELVRIDRVINWRRNPRISAPDGTFFYPAIEFEIIKNTNEYRSFWVEVCRTGRDWVNKIKSRFSKLNEVYTKLRPEQQPTRLVMISDGDHRIPFLAAMANYYMPNIKILFTTDERLLAGLNENTFLTWDTEQNSLVISEVPFLQAGYPGMSASTFLATQKQPIEEDDNSQLPHA